MKKFQENINKQIAAHQGINLFSDQRKDTFRFIPETIQSIQRVGEIDKDTEILLIEYTANKAIQEFCRTNQYYNFNQKAQKKLKAIYADLFFNIRSNKLSLDLIAKNHYDRLTKWLTETNSFAKKHYSSEPEIIESVACSEYSAVLQIEVLQIEISELITPVLDIGCGKQGNLVLFLRNQGVETYGFDRFAYDQSFITNSDWFDYNYEIGKWGAIFSNLGFTNHFHHHHLREDGNFIEYAKKYMDILNSLKVGGSFHYAPDLPFIEKYLDEKKYLITQKIVGDYTFKSTKITRLQ